MDISFLTNYFTPVIVGICLGVGYVVKSATPVENRYIPLINAVLGILLSVWMNWNVITPEIILNGLFSGLASTGLHEAFRNMIGNRDRGE